MPDGTGEFDVQRVAALACLTLDPAEAETFAEQIPRFLAYAARVRDVETADVPPMPHVLAPALPERADVVVASLTLGEALANVPDRDGAFVRVPQVLGRP